MYNQINYTYDVLIRYHCVKYRNFDLISWCGSFVETHSFRIVSGESPVNCAFPQNFHTVKLGEITAFYAVYPYKMSGKGKI